MSTDTQARGRELRAMVREAAQRIAEGRPSAEIEEAIAAFRAEIVEALRARADKCPRSGPAAAARLELARAADLIEGYELP